MTVYLDNAATTRPCDAAIRAFEDSVLNYGNPSSLHKLGLNAQLSVDKARKQIASALSVAYEQIIFTSGATESNNLAIRGVCEANKRTKNKIVTSAVEHPSVENTCKYLEENGGIILPTIPEGCTHNAHMFYFKCKDLETRQAYILPALQWTAYLFFPVIRTF